MKYQRLLAVLMLLIAGTPAWGKKNPSRQFMLREEVELNGTQLPAGIYELAWETQGPSAHLTLSKDGKCVATAQGAMVKSGMKFAEDAALLLVNSDGTKSLIEIRIAGATKAIVLNHSDAAAHYSAMKR